MSEINFKALFEPNTKPLTCDTKVKESKKCKSNLNSCKEVKIKCDGYPAIKTDFNVEKGNSYTLVKYSKVDQIYVSEHKTGTDYRKGKTIDYKAPLGNFYEMCTKKKLEAMPSESVTQESNKKQEGLKWTDCLDKYKMPKQDIVDKLKLLYARCKNDPNAQNCNKIDHSQGYYLEMLLDAGSGYSLKFFISLRDETSKFSVTVLKDGVAKDKGFVEAKTEHIRNIYNEITSEGSAAQQESKKKSGELKIDDLFDKKGDLKKSTVARLQKIYKEYSIDGVSNKYAEMKIEPNTGYETDRKVFVDMDDKANGYAFIFDIVKDKKVTSYFKIKLYKKKKVVDQKEIRVPKNILQKLYNHIVKGSGK